MTVATDRVIFAISGYVVPEGIVLARILLEKSEVH
jgi:hypothetical protein